MSATPGPRKTPLHDLHRQSGARMVEFAGWEMPVQYAGVIEEHLAVRGRAGIFDVSHMGEIAIRGRGALAAVQRLTCNDASRLADGEAQYSALTTERGTPVDDVLVHRLAEDDFLLCVNAANDEKDFAWIREHLPPGAEAVHLSDAYAQIALQGPLAEAILAPLTPAPLASLRRFAFARSRVAGRDALVARTGYTGEDGFEIYTATGDAVTIWTALMEAGAPRGLQPAGLGARDTLRLEACLPLYGNDIDDTTGLLEAGLGFIVKLDKGDFIGRDALARSKRDGVARRLAGFEMQDRAVARHGYPVALGGDVIGSVTSGTYAPSLRRNVGLAYLPAERAREGEELDVIVRSRPARARVVKTPFYRRGRPAVCDAAGRSRRRGRRRMYPDGLKYTKEHEWIAVKDGVGTIGITFFAQKELGDIVFVELPEIGRRVQQGEEFGTVESVKAVSEVYTPVSGEVVAVNGDLRDHPELVNQDPYGRGWILRLRLSMPSELAGLMDAAVYKAHVGDSES